MKHVTKILALLLTLTLLAGSVLAAGATKIEPGKVVLTISTEAEAVAGRLTVTYDPQILTYVSTETSLEITEKTQTSGALTLGYASTAPVTGRLAVLHFTYDAKKTQQTQIVVRQTTFDAQGSAKEETSEVPLLLEGARPHDETCPSKAFSDLDTGRWYHEYTDHVIESGLMKGMGEGRFSPNTALTRGQLVTTLHRLAGAPKPERKTSFADVSEGQYFAEAVAWAESLGIVQGMTATRFCPNGTVTREQAATFLYRYVTTYLQQTPAQGADLSAFQDGEQTRDYAKVAMAWAVAEELFQGYGDGTLRPAADLTRAQAAKLLTLLDRNF